MEVINNIKKQFDISQIINKDNTNNSNRDLEEVAQEFESLFINEMLKRAHSAKLAKTILTSDAEDTYTSLLNQERSKILAKNQPLFFQTRQSFFREVQRAMVFVARFHQYMCQNSRNLHHRVSLVQVPS